MGSNTDATEEEWKWLLNADERIVWQGTPSGKLCWEFHTPLEPLLLTFFTCFSIIWMVAASKVPGHVWMFGLLFFFVGFYGLVGVHFWKAYLRTKSHLTLTSKRAFIATAAFGKRKLRSYPITPGTVLEYVDGTLGSIFFAKEEVRDEHATTVVPIGFVMIDAARSVFALFRKVQEGNA